MEKQKVELDELLKSCRSLIKMNNEMKKNINKEDKSKQDSNVTLENVAAEVSHVLLNLQEHLEDFRNKSKQRSELYQNINKQLDEEFLKNKKEKESQQKGPVKPAASSKPTKIAAKKTVTGTSKNVLPKQKTTPRTKHRSLKQKARLPGGRAYWTAVKSSAPVMTKSISRARTSTLQPAAKPSYKKVYNSNVDPLQPLKNEVNNAVANRKTFTIQGFYPAVRRALVSRGWVEKFHSSFRGTGEDIRRLRTYSIQELLNTIYLKNSVENCRLLIKSKLLDGHQVDLWFGHNYEGYRNISDRFKLTLINRIRRGALSYTSKEGLCECAKFCHWYNIPEISYLNQPRTYCLTNPEDTNYFIDDFYLTAAMCLLKWVVRNSVSHESLIVSDSGKIPLSAFDFAVNECYKFLKKARHEDIDVDVSRALENDWQNFVEHFYKTVHIGNHFKRKNNVTEEMLVQKANFVLKKLEKYCPYMNTDGMMNIWILKPIASCQGIGIHICRTLEYVLRVVKENPNRRYIIQKYIERPLLIHSTKFDIRQWFLVSSTNPLSIWIYKECYIRFSSQTYNLRKLHESVHLTNNCVQCRYSHNTRDISLPVYNMWDLTQFKNYLSDIGYPEVYNNIIYPGMKQCINAAILMHQDAMDKRKNTFEMYGADFMISEDFKPWLIEINSNPAMTHSTPITTRMCPKVQEDVIRVVIDHAKNPKLSPGQFELIYRDKVPPLPSLKTNELKLVGKPLKISYFCNLEEDVTLIQDSPSVINVDKEYEAAHVNLKKITEGIKVTLQNLLSLVQKEKMKRSNYKNESINTVFTT